MAMMLVSRSSSDQISEVINDNSTPWFFDPAYNGENEAYAFSSGLTGSGSGISLSQVGFKVKGPGLFTGEFYAVSNAEGYGANSSLVGYKVGDKFTPSKGNSYSSEMAK